MSVLFHSQSSTTAIITCSTNDALFARRVTIAMVEDSEQGYSAHPMAEECIKPPPLPTSSYTPGRAYSSKSVTTYRADLLLCMCRPGTNGERAVKIGEITSPTAKRNSNFAEDL